MGEERCIVTVWKIFMILSVTLTPAFPQQPESTGPKPTEQAEQTSSQASQGEQHRSALEVKPGEEAIKNKDLFEASGYFHPFRRMPRFVMADQKKIWTSPFHTSKSDAKYWAIFGGATGALIAFDEQIQKNAPNPGWLVTLGTRGSYLGAAYTLIPISAGFYFLGSKTRNERFREAGLMSFESLINSTIVEEVLKVTTDRDRPLEGTGEGRFFHSPNRINAGFPSGHTINTFALASIFAHEYHDKLWVKILVYTYAGAVGGARMAADKHFPSDTLAGAAMGWFIGDYIYGKRHNPELDRKPTVAERILDHVHVGIGALPAPTRP
jgi:membrane-associated phospholipid phosphatase